jgi:hypothetical protein
MRRMVSNASRCFPGPTVYFYLNSCFIAHHHMEQIGHHYGTSLRTYGPVALFFNAGYGDAGFWSQGLYAATCHHEDAEGGIAMALYDCNYQGMHTMKTKGMHTLHILKIY